MGVAMKPKVIWTQREWGLLAQYFIDVGLDPDAYGFSRSLDHAQKKVLPKERWRSVKGVPATLKKEVKTQIGILQHQQREDALIPEPTLPSASDFTTEELLVELAKRCARVLDAMRLVPIGVTNSADQLVDVMRKHHNPCPKSEEKKERKRILVVGPNGDTSQSLRAQFPNLDLRFFKYEENPAHVALKARGVDSIVCITKFVTHAVADHVKATAVPTKMLTTVREAREWLATL